MALWRGNREEAGRVTGRRYPRTSFPKRSWVHPQDVEAAPHLWERVIMPEPLPEIKLPTPIPVEEEPSGLDALMKGLIDMGVYFAGSPAPPPPIPRSAALPNVRQVLRLAKAEEYPIFVAPRRDYPSYGDLWELIRVSGFELSHADQINLADDTKTYIFASPEGIPDCSTARARTIFWQLEYAGDYTEQPNKDTVSEIWASDPATAKRKGYRYVLLGSHPDLNPDPHHESAIYDVVMLAYMTGRRQAIKGQLGDLSWPPDYPGHVGSLKRHEVLKQSRLMLHVHQHDDPALAPLRYALAAAYRLPVLAEKVKDKGPYSDYLQWADYGAIPSTAPLLRLPPCPSPLSCARALVPLRMSLDSLRD